VQQSIPKHPKAMTTNLTDNILASKRVKKRKNMASFGKKEASLND